MKWQTIPLGSFAVKRGSSVNPAKFPNEVFELFSIPAFDSGTPETRVGSDIGSAKKCVEPNDVLVSRIVPHIRRSWVVGAANGHRQIASSEWIQFRSPDLYPNYLRHFLVSDPFHHRFMQTVSGVGGSLLRARPAEVFKIHVPLPPLEEQKRIAGILDAADALRIKRRESLAQLDALLQSTFLTLFGNPVENPMRWEVASLGDLASAKVNNGIFRKNPEYSPTGTDGLPVVWVGELFRGNKVDIAESRRLDATPAEVEKYGLRYGDILFCRSSLKLEGIAYNNVYLGGDLEALFECHLIRLSPRKERVHPVFLNILLRSAAMRAVLKSKAKTATMTTIDQKAISSVKVIVPNLDLQNRFATIVQSVEQQRACQRAHLVELDSLFAALQHRAFNGSLRAA